MSALAEENARTPTQARAFIPDPWPADVMNDSMMASQYVGDTAVDGCFYDDFDPLEWSPGTFQRLAQQVSASVPAESTAFAAWQPADYSQMSQFGDMSQSQPIQQTQTQSETHVFEGAQNTVATEVSSRPTSRAGSSQQEILVTDTAAHDSLRLVPSPYIQETIAFSPVPPSAHALQTVTMSSATTGDAMQRRSVPSTTTYQTRADQH